MNDRVPLTRTDLLKFNPRWDRLDRAVIDEDVDIQGGVIFERETTGYATIHVADKNGAWVLSVSKGTIYYPDGVTRPGSVYLPSHGAHVYRLSTSQGGAGAASKSEGTIDATCAVCHIAVPLTGICDNCY